jgi:hypothetical protein
VTSTLPAFLNQVQRERLRALADVLILGGAGLPSASEAARFDDAVDRTLRARPDLVDVVLPVVTCTAEPQAALDQLCDKDPKAFELFAYAVAAGYLMTAQVRRLLGYPGIAPRREPPHAGEAEYYLEDEILAPVIGRGPIYRQVCG